MPRVIVFAEDAAHEVFVGPLVRRIANEHQTSIEVSFRSSSGGFGRVLKELRVYVRDLRRGLEALPDLLIACVDGNCKGYTERRNETQEAIGDFPASIIFAIPDPHVERWFLLDSHAFRLAVGQGCDAPPQKCERDLFKGLLLKAVVNAGIRPPLGGIEYAEEIVNQMDLEYLRQSDQSLGRLIDDLRNRFTEWGHLNS